MLEAFKSLFDDGYVLGSEREFDLWDEEFVDRHLRRLRWLKDNYFRFEAHGYDRIPDEGGALLVMNHGLLPLEPYFLGVDLWADKHRLLRALTDRRAYLVPHLRELYRKMGVVEGHRETTIGMLKHGELCCVMPGGGGEAGRDSRQKYKLIWDDHTGFIIVALESGAPLFPIVTIGVDDIYTIPFSFKIRVLGGKVRVPLFPFGWGPLPRPVKLTMYIGEPIDFAAMGYGPKDAEDVEVVMKLREHVESTMNRMFQEGLEKRVSVWF